MHNSKTKGVMQYADSMCDPLLLQPIGIICPLMSFAFACL